MIKKLSVDLAMALLFVTLLGFKLTGGFVHEWIGIFFFGLVVIHTILNLRWYKSVLKGSYGVLRCVSTILNLLLIVTMVIICISGILNSSHVFKFLQLDGGMGIRQIHSFFAYWGLVLLGIHAGLCWKMVTVALYKMIGIVSESRLIKNILRIFAFLVAIYGVWASLDRNMAAKLFQGASFDYWNLDGHSLIFYGNYLAILVLYILATHYVVILTSRLDLFRSDFNLHKLH